MKRLHQHRESFAGGINISPLMDISLLLLIFFLVTASMVEEGGFAIDQPMAAHIQELERGGIVLKVTEGGEIYCREEKIGLNRLRGVLSALMHGKTFPVVIVADRLVPSGLLVDVMDEISAAGSTQISLATRREPEGR